MSLLARAGRSHLPTVGVLRSSYRLGSSRGCSAGVSIGNRCLALKCSSHGISSFLYKKDNALPWTHSTMVGKSLNVSNGKSFSTAGARTPAPEITEMESTEVYPWLLSFVDERSGKRVIKLLNPYQKKSYIVEEFNGIETEIVRRNFWASRYGWIICNNIREPFDLFFVPDELSVMSTFLFSPFTGEIIKFPELKVKLEGFPPMTSLFIDPASPECTAYAVWRRTGWVLMATCSPGDTEWKTFKFPYAGFMEFQPYGVTYLNGSFYSITNRLEVGVFNLSTREWKLLKPNGPKPCFVDDYNYYGTIVHSDTDLLWYEVENVPEWGNYACGRVANVWRFDFTKNSWILENKLGNRTIFSTRATTFSVGAAGKGKELVGMVFADKKFVSIGGESIQPSEDSWSYAEFYDWMAKERKSKNIWNVWNMWVDPRLVWRKSDLLKHSEVPSRAII